jgi:hypothetical protein
MCKHKTFLTTISIIIVQGDGAERRGQSLRGGHAENPLNRITRRHWTFRRKQWKYRRLRQLPPLVQVLSKWVVFRRIIPARSGKCANRPCRPGV